MSAEVPLGRQQLEAKIEELIALLDLLDGDENLEPYLAGTHPDGPVSLVDLEADDSDYEDGGDTEPNGDELDTSSTAEEGSCSYGFDGSGVTLAERMIRANPVAEKLCVEKIQKNLWSASTSVQPPFNRRSIGGA